MQEKTVNKEKVKQVHLMLFLELKMSATILINILPTSLCKTSGS